MISRTALPDMTQRESVISSIASSTAFAPGRRHCRRLRDYYRSAGWPCLDAMEVELLNAGLIERVQSGADQPEVIRVTDSGLRAIGESLVSNRKAFDVHENLVSEMARDLSRSGRLVFRGLSLRGRVGEAWRNCKPDVYSIRSTSVAAYAHPAIHEIKVRRADLLTDLKSPEKRAAYMALSSEFYYVMPEGLARVEEIPEDCGVLFRTSDAFVLARNSPKRAVELSISEWMALARRGADSVEPEAAQGLLVERTQQVKAGD